MPDDLYPPTETTEQIAKVAPAETPAIATDSPPMHVQQQPKPKPNQQGKGPKPKPEYTGPSQADVQKMREAFQKQSDRMTNLEKTVDRLEKTLGKMEATIGRLADQVPAALKAHDNTLQAFGGVDEWLHKVEGERVVREEALAGTLAQATADLSAFMNRMGMTALGRQTKAELAHEAKLATRPDAPLWARLRLDKALVGLGWTVGAALIACVVYVAVRALQRG